MSFGKIINFNFNLDKKKIIYTDKYTITFISNYPGLFKKDSIHDFLKNRGIIIEDIYISKNNNLKELSAKEMENSIFEGNNITFKLQNRNDIYLFFSNQNDYISVYIENKEVDS